MYEEKKSYMDAVILNWNQYYLTECLEAARAGRLGGEYPPPTSECLAVIFSNFIENF
jgi:hypothetical protein